MSTIGASASTPPAPLANAPTDFAAANRWIFRGSAAVQAVPDPNALVDHSLAVVRGNLKTRDGAPVICGRVSVAGHAEYGTATTLWDGSFALAVNGTSPLLLELQGPASSSFLPLQRRVVPRIHDYSWIEEARLTPYTGSGTLIDGTNRFAFGPSESDSGGSRRLAAYFPIGTVATVDGVAYTSFSVRPVEYTVGAGGPAAMPGLLPASSGYTFAANFELVGHERKKVTFSGPVILYVDNWAGVPKGTIVPNGSYDENSGIWLPEPSGSAIEIDLIAGGLASVSGAGETLSDAELAELAKNYPVGAKLWRLKVTHFSSFDWNFALRALAGAIPPGSINFFTGDTTKPSCRKGSIIECENQTLGEVLPLAGTSFSLFYSSARQPGRWREIGASVEKPSSAPIKRVEAVAAIAGQQLTSTVTEATVDGKTYYQLRFRWDGRDLAGRVLSGRQRAHVKVGFVYPAEYFSVTTFGDPAAMSPNPAISFTADTTRKEATLYRETEAWVDTWSDSIQGLGGWSLSPVHYYDAESQALYRGDGSVVHAETKDATILTVAGGGGGVLTSGAAARAVNLPYELDVMAAGPDRSVYLGTEYDGIWKLVPDTGDVVDGFKNAQIQRVGSLPGTKGLVVDGNGRVLYSSTADDRVYRYDPATGVITPIAGTSSGAGAGVEDVNPTLSALDTPRSLALLPDGTLFIADAGNDRVRRITPGPNPLIRTVAGGGSATTSGSKATALALANINGLAARANGDLFVATESQVWRVRPDGYADLVVGGGTAAAEEGVAAATATFNSIRQLAIAPDGTLFFTHWNPKCRVYRLEADTTLRIVGGTGACVTDLPDNGRAADARLDGPVAIAIDSRGDVFVGNQGQNTTGAAATHRIVRFALERQTV